MSYKDLLNTYFSWTGPSVLWISHLTERGRTTWLWRIPAERSRPII